VSRGESIRNRFAISAAALAGVIAFVQSYRRWLDPIIDSGRDLYIPEQLRLGAHLYRDILYYYPPLTPYLLAAVTAVTGSSLGAYIAIGLATALLTAIAIWLIVRPLAGEFAAAAALLIFFSFSMAGVGGWGSNYLFPYAHAATFAMLFFLWTAATIVTAWRESPASRAASPTFALLLLLAASWTKIEYALFSAILLVFLTLTRRMRWTWLVAYAASMSAIAVIAMAIFDLGTLRANVLPPSLLGGASARAFYAHVTGANAWQGNLVLAAEGAALVTLFAALLAAWERRPRLRPAIFIAIGMTSVLLANDTFFRAWTLLQLALMPFAIRRPREPLALLLVISLCASSRIYLNITPAWYGFVFMIPVVVLMVYVFFEWLPRRGLYSRATAAAWALPFVLVAASGLLAAHAAYSEGEPVTTKRGAYVDRLPQRAAAMQLLLQHLERVHARELVVMPEGLTINYLASVRTRMRYQTFTPVEIAGDEQAVIADLDAKRPRYVLIVPRDVREFGYRGFGLDYGQAIVAWLRARYTVEARFGAMVLLRRTRRG